MTGLCKHKWNKIQHYAEKCSLVSVTKKTVIDGEKKVESKLIVCAASFFSMAGHHTLSCHLKSVIKEHTVQ